MLVGSTYRARPQLVRGWPSISRRTDVSAVVIDPSSLLPGMSVADSYRLGKV
jgi:hypothetical protein